MLSVKNVSIARGKRKSLLFHNLPLDKSHFITDCKWCDNDTWIILDSEGNIRVWDSTSEELFFGKEKDIVYQKAGNDEYIKIAV